MPVRGNQFRSNTFREEDNSKVAGRGRLNKERAEILPRFTFNNGRAVKILGLFFLVLSLYFLVAFTSYMFTWEDDQSYVLNGGWDSLFGTNDELVKSGAQPPVVENWLGKFGALLSHQFIYKWFGVASFLFIGILFIVGYRLLFKVKVASITKTFGYSFFLLVFISETLAFFHSFTSDFPHFLEGEFGFWTNRLLQAQIGNAGIAGLLAFAALTALVIAYNIDFKIPERKKKMALDVPPVPDEVELEDEIKSEPVEFPLNSSSRRNRARTGERPEEERRPQPLTQQRVMPAVETDSSLDELPVRHIPLETVAATTVAFNIEKPVAPDETSDMKPQVQRSSESREQVKQEPELTIEKTPEEKTASELVEQFGQYDPKLDLSSYVHPQLDLLDNHRSGKISVSAEELEANKNKIVETLNNYNIEIDKIKATIGPTVTLYEIIPAPGIRISKIKNLEDDIALSLAALGIRIIAPMPGKGTIGIEVPNQQPEMVAMRSVMATEKFQNTTMDLPIALGKTISNEVYIADLAKMPHLLVAGATGQGKSVGINAILVSLLYKLHPSQLKFVLVDPKKVELTLFKKIERHFLAKLPGEEDAIITDTKKVINTLNSLCIEMDQRYDLLKNAQVRNLKEYNQKFVNRRLNPEEGHRFLPFIVLVIDEFADLMMTAGKEVETPIARLAQLARAVGIHLVIATQRPSVNIITGTIKANFPARLAFRVLSKIDSRTILDSGGADQLIGRGDMLLSTGSDLIRLQCAFVDTPEVERISDFIGQQRGYSSAWLLPEYFDENGEGGSVKDFDPDDRDPLFEDAARLIVMHQQGSTSLIQRKLKLGYNRAGRIIDQLEAAGVVGPFEGSKAREVLLPDDYALEQFLENLNKG
ncbi:FtsK/SpoIIIE family DNA translocase [Pararcticibacter amylolyticus]|uniref:Cell division protein FtsK n=1 Tax=Pararcticibacter amylolyticus TaxID=2173175 RepID=A0A2U2PEB7_9SPHI|nr:DNA translocase FtsK [Pararcticibacter amylolyticus]PWG79726.1 cell division protein FtsK [Pararcticibacter amylolyticus]